MGKGNLEDASEGGRAGGGTLTLGREQGEGASRSPHTSARRGGASFSGQALGGASAFLSKESLLVFVLVVCVLLLAVFFLDVAVAVLALVLVWFTLTGAALTNTGFPGEWWLLSLDCGWQSLSRFAYLLDHSGACPADLALPKPKPGYHFHVTRFLRLFPLPFRHD